MMLRLEAFETEVDTQLRQLGDYWIQNQHQIAELTRATQDHVNQLQDAITSVSQEVAALQSSNRALEARAANLDALVEQQQEQIRQLSSAGSGYTRDLSMVRVDHLALQDEHRALCECLGAAGAVLPLQVRARARIHRGLGLLQEAMNDKQITKDLWGLAGSGVPRLLLCSITFNGIRDGFLSLRKSGGLEKATAASTEWDVERLLKVASDKNATVWSTLQDYEPSASTLSKWAQSTTVSNVLGQLVIESEPGGCDVMKFHDIYKLLNDMGLSMEQFAGKFVYGTSFSKCTRSFPSIECVCKEILKRFRLQPVEGKNVMRFRDLYRLLEVIGFNLERFEKQFANFSEVEPSGSLPVFGKYYKALRIIGKGSRGICYLGEDSRDKTKVAIKWPVQEEEVDTYTRLKKYPGLGLPRLLYSGEYQDRNFIVIPPFGTPLLRLFPQLEGQSNAKRWRTLKVLGRLMVRRLQSLHDTGYVHCDISPENILFGPAPPLPGPNSPRFAPFLVDFGHAQRWPNGACLAAGDAGSIEWSSIRSARGGKPLPEDDLQALGWVLLHGTFGELPWFKWLQRAYKDWESRFTRDQIVRQAQQAKIQLLKDGWASFGSSKGKVPEELLTFIRACCPEGSLPELAEDGAQDHRNSSVQEPASKATRSGPDYNALVELLGGSADLNQQAAEEKDLRLFTECLLPVLQ